MVSMRAQHRRAANLVAGGLADGLVCGLDQNSLDCACEQRAIPVLKPMRE